MFKRGILSVLLLAGAAVLFAPVGIVHAAGYTTAQPSVIGGCSYACSYSEFMNVTWYHDHSTGYVATPTLNRWGCSETGSNSWGSSCYDSGPSCYRVSNGQYNCDDYFTAVDAELNDYYHLDRIRMFSDGSWDQYGSY